MHKTFLEELNDENVTGVAYKNVNLKKNIILFFANSGSGTISELCKELGLSAPKITDILNELIAEGLIRYDGKVNSTGGRRPYLYGVVPESAFFIGVDIKQSHINFGLADLQSNIIKSKTTPFVLKNDEKSLAQLCQLIGEFVKSLPVAKDKILGIGVNISGRVNHATGYSYSFFHFGEEPLSKIIEKQIGIRTFIENDSRAMAYGEFMSGKNNEEKDVLFLNLDYGIGTGIVINNDIYYGKSGYAGEFGHIPFFNNEIICHCGKKGCLETEASGWAMERMFQERLADSTSIVVTKYGIKPEDVKMEDIIRAVNDDDFMSIELIAEIGENLGRGIAILINLFNPELVILGGSLATTQEYIRLPIKSAINKYSLSLVNNDTKVVMSQLGDSAGIVGACLLVRDRLLVKE